MSVETKEPPVFVVRGQNWYAHVPINEYNQQFSVEHQMLEAASQAIEALKGIANGIFLTLDEGQEKPYVGPALHVYPKDTNPDNGALIFSYLAFANGGFYSDSLELQAIVATELKAMRAKEQPAKKKKGKSIPAGEDNLELESFDVLKKNKIKSRKKK